MRARAEPRVRRLAFAAALLFAGAAQAAPRIALSPIDGAKPALMAQLRSELCQELLCVPWREVSTAGALDTAKLRRWATSVLVGKVTASRGGRRVLLLSLLTPSRLRALSWRLPLDAQGRLGPAALPVVRRDLDRHLGVAPRAPAEPVAPAPPASSAEPRREPPPAAPAPVVAPAPAPVAAPTVAPPDPPAAREVPLPPPPVAALPYLPPASRPRLDPWIAVEVGAFATRRELAFEEVALSPARLRAYTAGLIAGPQARLELFPVAPLGSLWAGGLGLLGGYGTALGLRTAAPGGEQRPTAQSRLSLGLLWRSPPLTSLRFTVEPAVSWEDARLAVRPSIPGLPDARLQGLKGSLALTLPLAGPVSFLLAGGYVRWTTARDLIAGEVRFFPSGRAWALEAEAGLALFLGSSLSLRAAGTWSETRYRLDPDPAGVYSASGASDSNLGARLSLRATL